MSIPKPQKNSNIYKTNKKKISGSSFSEVRKEADRIFDLIKSKSKRSPYIRSKYFRKEKVFLNLFWTHIFDKHNKDKIRRLKFIECGIDLIKNSAINPESKDNVDNKSEEDINRDISSAYVKGYNLDWESLHQNENQWRIALPTYPFVKKRYWASLHQPAQEANLIIFVYKYMYFCVKKIRHTNYKNYKTQSYACRHKHKNSFNIIIVPLLYFFHIIVR